MNLLKKSAVGAMMLLAAIVLVACPQVAKGAKGETGPPGPPGEVVTPDQGVGSPTIFIFQVSLMSLIIMLRFFVTIEK